VHGRRTMNQQRDVRYTLQDLLLGTAFVAVAFSLPISAARLSQIAGARNGLGSERRRVDGVQDSVVVRVLVLENGTVVHREQVTILNLAAGFQLVVLLVVGILARRRIRQRARDRQGPLSASHPRAPARDAEAPATCAGPCGVWFGLLLRAIQLGLHIGIAVGCVAVALSLVLLGFLWLGPLGGLACILIIVAAAVVRTPMRIPRAHVAVWCLALFLALAILICGFLAVRDG
jgi:hypothetical protein